MPERVRALLITPSGQLLTIRRDRPGTPTYWVLPGGHVKPTDASLEQALQREVLEELGGKAEIVSLVATVGHESTPEHIYLGRIESWSEHDRAGPEFADPARGTYTIELVPLTSQAIEQMDLKPDSIATIIRQQLNAGADLFAMHDLRTHHA